jgi:hypothetical protein
MSAVLISAKIAVPIPDGSTIVVPAPFGEVMVTKNGAIVIGRPRL